MIVIDKLLTSVTLREVNVVVLVEHWFPRQALISVVLSILVVWLNEDTLVGVNGEDTVGVSNLTVEDNTDGSVDEVVKGTTVSGEPMTVVPRSKVLFCNDSVVYWNVVLMKNVTLIPWSTTALVAVVLSSTCPSVSITVDRRLNGDEV